MGSHGNAKSPEQKEHREDDAREESKKETGHFECRAGWINQIVVQRREQQTDAEDADDLSQILIG